MEKRIVIAGSRDDTDYDAVKKFLGRDVSFFIKRRGKNIDFLVAIALAETVQ